MCRSFGSFLPNLCRYAFTLEMPSGVVAPPLGHRILAKSYEREMPERRHRTSLDQADMRRRLRPAHIARPRELGAPAKPSRRRREPMLQRATQPGLRADAADQNDFAARLENASELVERCLRVRDGRNHILGDNHIEGRVWKGQAFGVHDGEPLDIAEAKLAHPLLRLAQHPFGNIDTEEPTRAGIVWQRNPG